MHFGLVVLNCMIGLFLVSQFCISIKLIFHVQIVMPPVLACIEQVVCDRYAGSDAAQVRSAILKLLEPHYYIPVLRDPSYNLPPIIGEIWSPNQSELLIIECQCFDNDPLFGWYIFFSRYIFFSTTTPCFRTPPLLNEGKIICHDFYLHRGG